MLDLQTAPEMNPETQDAAPRTVLVDAFNVLHAVLLGKDRTAGWWRREHRERLLERVCDWRGGPDQIWVAFDGNHPAESVWAEPVALVDSAGSSGADSARKSAPTIHSLFVESADDWIVRRARKAERPENVIVVSADRKVAGRARSAGCEVWTPWAFIAECTNESVSVSTELVDPNCGAANLGAGLAPENEIG